MLVMLEDGIVVGDAGNVGDDGNVGDLLHPVRPEYNSIPFRNTLKDSNNLDGKININTT